jgi:hypothetical protein
MPEHCGHSSVADLQEQLDRRTRERDEAQEQQAATAEVLNVISRSAFDLQTAFKAIIANAVRLCHAHMGAVHLFDGELVDIVVFHNFPPEAVKVLQSMYPRPPRPDQASGRAILTGKVAEIEDMLADPQYTREVTVAGQWGSILAVPMFRDGTTIGAIVITRRTPNLASQICTAFTSIDWKTGASSPGEELMTLSTSAVAVCCCSDSRSSLSSRVFSMAMTAWAAKFFTSSICLSVNGRTSWR